MDSMISGIAGFVLYFALPIFLPFGVGWAVATRGERILGSATSRLLGFLVSLAILPAVFAPYFAYDPSRHTMPFLPYAEGWIGVIVFLVAAAEEIVILPCIWLLIVLNPPKRHTPSKPEQTS